MRIVGGRYKGRFIARVRTSRLTTDKVKAALFNILGETIEGARFLDACAGSGAVGLEALSRGASAVTWVERERACCRILRENLERVADAAGQARTELLCLDAEAALRRLASRQTQFDLIFLDPPYHDISLLKKALRAIERHAILRPAGFVVVEHDRRNDVSQLLESLTVAHQYRYGDTMLSVCRWRNT